MNFIDRNKELGRLEAALKGCKGKLLVVYGRRRLGKSRLIKRILKEGDVYYEANKSESSTQRLGLAASVALLYNDFDKPTYSTWDSLLSTFNNQCKEGATLMLDEFPYLVERDSSLPSVIQTIVDSGTMRYNLLICGSSQRMMQKLVLDGSEPLYGRASEKINLGPIRAQYWWHALNLSAKQVVEEYSVWGGVPRYWVLREQYSSLDDALENLILDEHGPLAEEPEALFLDDTNVIAPYISIMSAIGQGNAKFSRIADVVGHKVSELAPMMKNLIAMHYVRKEVPFGEDVDTIGLSFQPGPYFQWTELMSFCKIFTVTWPNTWDISGNVCVRLLFPATICLVTHGMLLPIGGEKYLCSRMAGKPQRAIGSWSLMSLQSQWMIKILYLSASVSGSRLTMQSVSWLNCKIKSNILRLRKARRLFTLYFFVRSLFQQLIVRLCFLRKFSIICQSDYYSSTVFSPVS